MFALYSSTGSTIVYKSLILSGFSTIVVFSSVFNDLAGGSTIVYKSLILLCYYSIVISMT